MLLVLCRVVVACFGRRRPYICLRLGLRVREDAAHQRGGVKKKGKPAVSRLVEIGRRLSAADFVTFLVFFRDIHTEVDKVSCFFQRDGTEGPETEVFAQTVVPRLQATARSISSFLVYSQIAFYVLPFLKENDLRRYWACFVRYTKAGVAFPTVTRHMWDIQRGVFQDCGLQHVAHHGDLGEAAAAQDGSKYILLGPRCRCATRQVREPGVRVSVASPRGDLLVPHWVAHTPHKSQVRLDIRRMKAAPFDPVPDASALTQYPPRFHRKEREARTPAALQGLSRYTQAGQCFRCVYPRVSAELLTAIDGSIRQALSYVEDMVEEYRAYLNEVGVNRGVRELLRNAAVCWNWRKLLWARPEEPEVTALLAVDKALRPLTAKAEYPGVAEFPYVQRFWPNTFAISVQYLRLCKRLAAAEHATGCFTCVVEYRARFVGYRGAVAAFAPLLRSRLRGASVVLPIVSAFLGVAQMLSSHTFRATAASLCLCGAAGSSAKAKSAKLNRRRFRFVGGLAPYSPYATIVDPPTLRGRLVVVEPYRREVDVAAVARAIDTDRVLNEARADFSAAGSSSHCWHVCLLSHKCRPLSPRESPCERWGSYINFLWDDIQGLSPERIAARLFLREAGLRFVGGRRDEIFVATIVEIMLRGDGRKYAFSSLTKRACQAIRAGEPLAPRSQALRNLVLRQAGLEVASLWEAPGALELPFGVGDYQDPAFRATYRPSQLTERERLALHRGAYRRQLTEVERSALSERERQALSKGKLVLADLATFAEDSRTLDKDRAQSALKEKMVAWLASPEAYAWRTTRERMFSKAGAMDHGEGYVSDDDIV